MRASDASGIRAVSLTYTEDDGHWRSIEMAQDEALGVWRAYVPWSEVIEYIIQVVDGAGNVTIEDCGGAYCRLACKSFLPLILRQE